MDDRQEIEVVVLDIEEGQEEWPIQDGPKGLKLSLFKEWIDKMIAAIPADHLDSATIKITAYDWDTPTPQIVIGYRRPETEDERARRIALREAKATERTRMEEHVERAILARLKAKYEGEKGDGR